MIRKEILKTFIIQRIDSDSSSDIHTIYGHQAIIVDGSIIIFID